eukprot:TRINITY_DN12692_c0_g1_i1.p1 TRINITY_DN12692_c0_g1~~TRINITY_DN12692_c0_g1_i1.p1  ORF type:complete len:130 (-),score=37.31 TRINITY_DN12692_c0_g1_i1:9-398(-)
MFKRRRNFLLFQGVPFIAALGLGSYFLSRVLQGKLDDIDARKPSLSRLKLKQQKEQQRKNQSEPSSEWTDSIDIEESKKKLQSIEEEFEQIKQQQDLSAWEPVAVPRTTKRRRLDQADTTASDINTNTV